MRTHLVKLVGIAAVLACPIGLNAADAPATTPETKAATTIEAKAPPATEAKATATADSATAKTTAATTVEEGTAKPAKPVYCQSSGRIKVRADSKNGCDSAQKPYRSFSKEQIDTTGETDTAEALLELDPIFQRSSP